MALTRLSLRVAVSANERQRWVFARGFGIHADRHSSNCLETVDSFVSDNLT